MSGNPQVIYSAASIQQAHLLRGLLEDEGIPARVVNDAIQMAGGELPLGWTSAARVVVPEQHAQQARELAERFDHRSTATSLGDETPSESVDQTLSDWPTCPNCGTRRSAQCPVCGTTGVAFPLADYQPGASGDRILFMCETCDDHMVPQWFRYCAGCDHDFGQGLEPRPVSSPFQLTPAAAFVLAALVLTALLFGAYFWWLLT